MDDEPVDSYWCAVEHYVWWRSRGLAHFEMLKAIGVRPPDCAVDAETVVRYLARAHRELLQPKARRAA